MRYYRERERERERESMMNHRYDVRQSRTKEGDT